MLEKSPIKESIEIIKDSVVPLIQDKSHISRGSSQASRNSLTSFSHPNSYQIVEQKDVFDSTGKLLDP